MARQVRVTVRRAPARPWWVLPVPHVHGLIGLFVLTLWLSIAACWYPVVLGALVLKYAAQGVMVVSELVVQYRAAHPKPEPEPEPVPEPQTDPSAPVWTHQQIVETLSEKVQKDFVPPRS